MRFPTTFTRYKPASGSQKLLGGDVLPVDANGVPRRPSIALDDNLVDVRATSINGWPAYRVVLAAGYVGAGPPIALPVAMYFYEENLGIWVLVPQSAGTVTPGTPTTPQLPVYFDCMALMDFPHVKTDLAAPTPGNIAQIVIVSDPGGAPNGTYNFAMAVDLTQKPF